MHVAFTPALRSGKLCVMQSENQIQYAFIKAIRPVATIDKRIALLHHIPNGGKLGKNRIHMHNMGCVRGIPDFFLPVAAQGFHGLYLELKTKKGKQSIDQQAIADQLQDHGYKYVLCRSDGEAIDAVFDYLGLNA